MRLTVSAPVQSLQEIRQIEHTPLAQAMPWDSTYTMIRETALACADRPALTMLHTGQVGGPSTTWTYRDLLQGIHQTANLLFNLGLRSTDVVAVLLPGGQAYHLALWGGEAAGIVQPLNPLLSDDKLASLLQASGAQVLIAHGVDDDSQMRMGDYFDMAAGVYGLPKPPRISRAQAQTELPAMQLSFMSESRRMVNTRMKRELRLQLRYAKVEDGLA